MEVLKTHSLDELHTLAAAALPPLARPPEVGGLV